MSRNLPAWLTQVALEDEHPEDITVKVVVSRWGEDLGEWEGSVKDTLGPLP